MVLFYTGDCSLRNQLWYTSWMLSFIGINIFDENWMKGWRIFIHTGLLLSFCVSALYISILSFPIESFLNIGKGLYDGYPILFLTSSILDILIITWTIYYRKDILMIFETAHREIDFHSEKEKNVYFESMKDIKIKFLAYFLAVSMAWVIFMFNIIISKEALISMPMLRPIGLTPIDESPNCEIIRYFFGIQPFPALMCRCGFLTTYITLVGNCCCQYKVLTCRIEHLIEEMANPEAETHRIKKILESTVNSHCLLISTVKELREIYQLIVASNMFLLVAFVIRFFTVRSIYSIALLLHPLLSIFICTYMSELLNSERENFRNSIYASEWYSISTFHRKHLFFIALLSFKSSYLTMAKMSDISLKAFQSILNFCYSGYALLESMY